MLHLVELLKPTKRLLLKEGKSGIRMRAEFQPSVGKHEVKLSVKAGG